MPVTLSTAEEDQMKEAAESLRRRPGRRLNTETTERFMNDSLDTLTRGTTTSTWCLQSGSPATGCVRW